MTSDFLYALCPNLGGAQCVNHLRITQFDEIGVKKRALPRHRPRNAGPA